jgi:arginase
MVLITVPYHLDEHLPDFDSGLRPDAVVTTPLPDAGPWQRMAALYERVAAEVAGAPDVPVVVSGDCTTSLGVLAGLQRSGREPGVVWFDAHADLQTEATTASGYLGGMPLALAVGVGTPTLPDLLGLRRVPEARVVLVDARDIDPPEEDLLARSALVRTPVEAVRTDELPDGPLYLHVDLDVCDPQDVPDLLFPAPGGPPADALLAALGRVAATGRVAAVGLAATWHHDRATPRHAELLAGVLAAATG